MTTTAALKVPAPGFFDTLDCGDMITHTLDRFSKRFCEAMADECTSPFLTGETDEALASVDIDAMFLALDELENLKEFMVAGTFLLDLVLIVDAIAGMDVNPSTQLRHARLSFGTLINSTVKRYVKERSAALDQEPLEQRRLGKRALRQLIVKSTKQLRVALEEFREALLDYTLDTYLQIAMQLTDVLTVDDDELVKATEAYSAQPKDGAAAYTSFVKGPLQSSWLTGGGWAVVA